MTSERINANSESLKSYFPDIYRNFIANSDVVVSSPAHFLWTGNLSVAFGGLAISQKIPLRVYVGISKSDKEGIHIADYYQYLPSRQNFKREQVNEHFKKAIKEFFNDYFKKALEIHDCRQGIDISAIFEVPRRVGLHSNGALSSSLTLALLLFYEVISYKDFEDVDKLNMDALLRNNKFDVFIRLAWKLDCLLKNGVSSGIGVFCSAVKSTYPIVYFTEKRLGKDYPEDKPKGINVPLILRRNIDAIDKIKYWAYSLGDMFQLEEHLAWPVDFGLIYTGRHLSDGAIAKQIEEITNINKNHVKYMREAFNISASKLKKCKTIPFFVDETNTHGGHYFWEGYLAVMVATALSTLRELSGAFLYGTSTLIEEVNHYHSLLISLNIRSNETDQVIRELRYEIGRYSENNVGIKWVVAGGDGQGDLLFVVPAGGFSSKIIDIIKTINERHLEERLFLDYFSVLDGTEKDGIDVVHYPPHHSSDMVPKDNIIHTHWPSLKIDREVHHKNESYSLVSRKYANYDVVFDIAGKKEKIFVLGNRLCAKDGIRSASVTSILFNQLMKNEPFVPRKEGTELFKDCFKRADDCKGQIINPLERAIRKRIADAMVNVVYSFEQNALSIKLEPSNINYHVISKKNP